LGMLAAFKYWSVAAGLLNRTVADGFNAILGALGFAASVADPGAVLPIGMTFYVFQSLTYTLGYYRGLVEREPSFLRYAAYAAMFPQLLSGPIERAERLLPQLRRAATIAWTDLADGLSLFVVGLFKKAVLADGLAAYVDAVYAAPSRFQAPALLLATFAYAWQIYFDFAGYSDMARGVARCLGLRLMLNFDNPYLATGLGDFWRRWHISLSTWFRDFVYIPLGGNRCGPRRTHLNMFVTMLLSGLWHGSTWNFALWGCIHGLGRVLTRRLEESSWYRTRVPRALKTLWVFLFVGFAWIFFRAKSLTDAWTILARIARWGWSDPGMPWLLVALVAAAWLYQALYESRLRVVLRWTPLRIAMMVAMVVGVALFARSGVSPFIYFQF
jgi:alginate O-acetyltransferase complex protein AlgI